MKKVIILIAAFLVSVFVYAQTSNTQVYNTELDAMVQLKEAMVKAKAENKHIYMQIGGNWCPWCIRLHEFCDADAQIDSLLKADFVVIKANYSKENKNAELMKYLEFPNRFGFPVLVVIDADGRRLHTQNSAYLEEGKGYSKEKIFEFLQAWSPKALKPEIYKF